MSAQKQEREKIERPDLPGFRTGNRTTQTRFHFHMDLCVGCHACEVACNEQNGLPADIQWRRVGEVEGGVFPDVKRLFMSSGCNHCLDAPCAKGCPVDAYKIDDKGLVIHQAEVCIGCQYCTWNCPYSVPQFQPERGVVSKCDMCVNRLDQGLDTACVQACPAGAIEIETVPIEEVFASYEEAGSAPGMPSPTISMPSTRITLPEGIDPQDLQRVDGDLVEPEDAHAPLIAMTVLTQLGLGGIAAICLSDALGALGALAPLPAAALAWLAGALVLLVGLSLGASTLHLGRPAFAFRAVRNWRTSWLSREVLALGLFAKTALAYAAFILATEVFKLEAAWIPSGHWPRLSLGAAALCAGIAGIYASARLYRVPARPAWNSRKTTWDFFAVSLFAGPAVWALALVLGAGTAEVVASYTSAAAVLAIAALALHMAVHALHVRRWARADGELKATAHLYLERFARLRWFKNGAALVGSMGYLALFANPSFAAAASALVGSLVYALLQRYLFFVTVVGSNIPGNYIVRAHRAVA